MLVSEDHVGQFSRTRSQTLFCLVPRFTRLPPPYPSASCLMSREQTLTDLKIPGRHANNSFSDSRHVRIPSEGVTDLESHERASGPRRPPPHHRLGTSAGCNQSHKSPHHTGNRTASLRPRHFHMLVRSASTHRSQMCTSLGRSPAHELLQNISWTRISHSVSIRWDNSFVRKPRLPSPPRIYTYRKRSRKGLAASTRSTSAQRLTP